MVLELVLPGHLRGLAASLRLLGLLAGVLLSALGALSAPVGRLLLVLLAGTHLLAVLATLALSHPVLACLLLGLLGLALLLVALASAVLGLLTLLVLLALLALLTVLLALSLLSVVRLSVLLVGSGVVVMHDESGYVTRVRSGTRGRK